MTQEHENILRAAVRAKLGLSIEVRDLIRGLPKRHAGEWTINEAAELVLRQFATGDSETQVLTRWRHDKLRDDFP